jgi:hypothetical protein
MSNPWTKKNPFMSMWLSGANALMGSTRRRTIAEARRQTSTLAAESTRQMIKFWTGGLTATPTRKRKRSR